MIIALVVAVLVLLANLVSWVAFRTDKARARRHARRIPERTLLWTAFFGAFGALAGMYLHRQRHKVDKRRFTLTVWLYATLQVVAPLTWLFVAYGPF